MGTRPAAGEELRGHSAAGAAVSATAAASRCWYESAFETDVMERTKRAFRHEEIRTAGEIEWGP